MVPILVYVFAFNPVLATSYSLFVVGSTALVGAFNNYRKGLVSIKTALLFGLTSVTTVFITRKFIMPRIPDVLFSIGKFQVKHDLATMVLFAILMLMASFAMIKGGRQNINAETHTGIGAYFKNTHEKSSRYLSFNYCIKFTHRFYRRFKPCRNQLEIFDHHFTNCCCRYFYWRGIG